MPRLGADQADADAVRGVGAGVEILGEQLAPLQVGLDAALQDLELRGRQLLVARAPPHLVGHLGLVRHELVLDGATGVHAGLDQQSAVRRQPPLAPADRVLDQLRGRKIRVHGAGRMDAGAGERGCGVGGAVSHG